MPHFLALLVIDAVGEIDGVIEEGGLGGRRGDYGHLRRLACFRTRIYLATYSFSIEQKDLHFRGSAAHSTVSSRHHLRDVARDSLEDIHGSTDRRPILFTSCSFSSSGTVRDHATGLAMIGGMDIQAHFTTSFHGSSRSRDNAWSKRQLVLPGITNVCPYVHLQLRSSFS